jgi:hypothetical protein
MQYLMTWTISASEGDHARILALFTQWKPPVDLQNWCGFADGSGGMALFEAADPSTIHRICTPWTPWLTFTIRALLPIQQIAVNMAEAGEFWASVKR